MIPSEKLHVWVRRASGNSDTFFNMRFGREGHTFDGRRAYLKDHRTIKASWALNGRRPEGKELIINSHNGSVHLERVVVVYRSGRQSDQYDGQLNDRYDRDDRYDRNDRSREYERESVYRSADRDDRYPQSPTRYDPEENSHPDHCRPSYSSDRPWR